MPIPVLLNIAIRNQVRKSMVLPRPLPILPDELFMPDTDQEAIDKLRKAGAIPTAAEAANEEARGRAASAIDAGPRPGGIITFTSFIAVPGSSWQAAVAGPITLTPFLIDWLTINIVAAAGAPGGTQTTSWTLLASTNNSTLLAQLQSDTNTIIDADDSIDGISKATTLLSGQDSQTFLTPINYPVPFSSAFLKVLALPGVSSTLRAYVSITQLRALAAAAGALYAPSAGRININISTAPPAARSTRLPTPRAGVVSVTQGGRIISSRTIAWESLEPAIQRDYFNRQFGPAEFPTVTFIV